MTATFIYTLLLALIYIFKKAYFMLKLSFQN